MTVPIHADRVGRFRYCPACAAPIGPAILASEAPGSDTFQTEHVRCSRCERPWTACPCPLEPVSPGVCDEMRRDAKAFVLRAHQAETGSSDERMDSAIRYAIGWLRSAVESPRDAVVAANLRGVLDAIGEIDRGDG